MDFSVVIPSYRCSRSLKELNERLVKTLSKQSEAFEIIYVNDASPENDWEIIHGLTQKDNRVKGINLSRNFGQHYAITAGLDYCTGQWVVVMDGDLQDQPEEIIKLYNKANQGYDIVLAQRKDRKDNLLKKQLSFLYYAILSFLTNTKIDPTVGTFRMMSRTVVDQFCQMREYFRFFGAMINWLGFDVAKVKVAHNSRTHGKSSYTLRKMISLGLNGIIAFSDKPLKISIRLGILMISLSSLFIAYKILQALICGIPPTGWSSLIASIFFSTGIIVLVLGITGLYIGRIFEQTKNRPLYIVKETKNLLK